MKPLIITETASTPFVYFNNQEGKFLIVGKSTPTNEHSFYASVIKWLDNYVEETSNEVELNIILETINNGSEVYLLQLLQKLEIHFVLGKKVSVKWYCEENDEKILNSITHMTKTLRMPIKNIIIDSIDFNNLKI